MATALRTPGPLEALKALLGPDGLITDADECAFYAGDVFTKGPPPLGVIRPASTEALGQAVALAAPHGLALIPRGGGMSYTGGYVAPNEGALIVDLGRMDRILAIDEIDMVATVEAGCTWDALRRALAPLGLRAKTWGRCPGFVQPSAAG